MRMAEANESDSLGLSDFDLLLREDLKKSQEFLQLQLKSIQEPKNRVIAFSEQITKTTASFKKSNSSSLFKELMKQIKKFRNNTENDNNKSPTRTHKSNSKQPLESIQESDQIGPHKIKQEKLSVGSNNDEEKENIFKNIKSEPDIEMPPPPIPRSTRKKTKKALKPEPSVRNTRSRTRKMAKKTDNEGQTSTDDDETDNRDSDVIVKPPNVSVIEITDDEDTSETPARNTKQKDTKKSVPRSSRARTVKNKKDLIQENTKRSRSLEEKSDTEDIKNNKSAKKTKYQKNEEDEEVEPQSAKDDTDKNAETQLKPMTENEAMNETVVLQNPSYVTSEILKPNEPYNLQDIMTSDESECEKVPDKNNKTKPIFNPYVKSPLKKKIEAFEKLGATAESPRTRMRAQKKDELSASKIPSAKHFGSSTLNRFLPSSQSTSKKNRMLPSSNTSVLHSKVASTTTKVLQAEYREREMRRREKEAEALHKKEAMLLAVVEEKKRICEEKQQKAQQVREMKEKDKQKHLEDAKRAKDLKLKQIQAEREEKFAKQRMEAERKRMMAKMKAQEEKRKEEQKNKMKSKGAPPQPIYMTQNTPLLPTTDCYDSDNESENEDRRNKYLPDWARSNVLLETEQSMLATGHQVKNTFFFVKPKTLDLNDIFPSIEPRKLTRSSSAMWTKPPRYTLCMSPLNEGGDDKYD